MRFHGTKFPFTETESEASRGDCFDETVPYEVSNDEERELDLVENQYTPSSDDLDFSHDNKAQHIREVETKHSSISHSDIDQTVEYS